MPEKLHAIDYLAAKTHADVPPVCVLFGDEPFLKRLVLAELRRQVLGDDGDVSFIAFDDPKLEFKTVYDELSTVALFGGGQRLVLVDDADDFISNYRPRLEDYVAKPKSSGVLVLSPKSWPSNTKLYKAVAASGLVIECSTPTGAVLLKWLTTSTRTRHDAKLDRQAAEALLEIVGPELGLLDQELAKLAVSAGPGGEITVELVHDLVGGWRAKTTWDMLDAASGGDAREALKQLDRLLLSGEDPIGVLAQISSTLRRFAAVTRMMEQGDKSGYRPTLRQALETAGFKSFVAGKAEGQLKQIGRVRGAKLYRWLLETDLALKRASSKARARMMLEQLIARLSAAADPRKTALTR
jgi:DNA polymerase-3 subunit delta